MLGNAFCFTPCTTSSNLDSRYLGDPEATKNAFNSDGYFKTGDIAYRKGDYYWIMGRESVDSELQASTISLPFFSLIHSSYQVWGLQDLRARH